MNYSDYKKHGWRDIDLQTYLSSARRTRRFTIGSVISFSVERINEYNEDITYQVYALQIGPSRYRYYDTIKEASAARVLFSLPDKGFFIVANWNRRK